MKFFSNKFILFTLIYFYALNVFSIVEGTYPDNSNLTKYSVFGSAVTTGNTMMATTPPGNVNDILLPQSSGDIRNIPYDAEIVAARIFWSGSLGPTLFTPDDNIKLITQDSMIHDITSNNCKVVTSMEGFYYCSADITEIIKNQEVFTYNGRYTVKDLKGDVGNCEENPYVCQAKYAAWSMIIVYKSESSKVKREILLYDSFLHLDEREDSIGITQFTINGLKVNSPARGEFTYFGLEGDRFLGVPPQDAPENQFPCPTCYDFIELNGVKLYDDLNPPNNIWNSSLATAVDIDTFRIGERGLNILRSGQNQSIVVRLGSGDGIIPNEHPEAGGGESVFLGYVLIALDTVSPNFRTNNTNLIVDRSEASQGDELTYILTVTNDGSQTAHNVTLSQAIPPETEYVPNSTYIDGNLTNDGIAGSNGLNIGTLDFRQGNNKKIITFRVKVKNNVENGTYIYNSIKITSDETYGDPTLTNKVSTLINAPNLQTPILTVKDENGGNYLPGEWAEYTVKIENHKNNPVSNIIYTNQLPSDFTKLSITAAPFNSTDNSDIQNKKVIIENIEIPARSTAIIKYRAKIKTISQYIDSGISEDQINNRIISNQGSISTLNTSEILTDNDNGGNEHDPTVFKLKKEVNADFSESTMTVENTNGSHEFHPGDTVKYTITVKNSASVSVNAINITDDINEEYFENIIPENNGRYDGNKIEWFINSLDSEEEKIITFTAKIKKPLPNNFVIENQASIHIPGRNDLTDDPSTPETDDPTKFTITASSPNFSLSTKEVIDENGGRYFQPGDYVTYTITLKNNGEDIGKNITVTDEISPYLTDIEVYDNGTYNNGIIKWSYHNNPSLISPIQDVTLKFRAKIKENTPDNTLISNQAKINISNSPIEFLTDNPNTPQINDSTDFKVKSAAEISQSYKTFQDLNGGKIEPGDEIKYAIEVRNTGNLPVNGIRVIDSVDTDNLEDINAENAQINNGTVTWNDLGSLQAGESITLYFTAKIKSDVIHNTEISNQAVIMSDEIPFALTDDPTTPEKNDPTKFKVNAAPDLTLIKKVSNLNGNENFKVGDRIKYELTLNNASSYQTGNITISDIIPTELENITVSPNGIINGNTVYFYIQPTTENIQMTIEGDIKEQGLICNQALLEDLNFDYRIYSDNPDTEEIQDSTCFNATGDIKITDFYKKVKNLNNGDFHPGDTIEYEISFKNRSNIPIGNITIKDNISNYLENIELIDGGDYNGESITFTPQNTPSLNNISENATIILKFKAKIKENTPDDTIISNRAELTVDNINLLSDNPDTPQTDSTDIQVKIPPLHKELKIYKSVNKKIFLPNEMVTYEIKLKNTGSSPVSNIEVTDKLDPNLVFSMASDNATNEGNTIKWSYNNTEKLHTVMPGQEVILILKARIKNSVSDKTLISNRAKAIFEDNENEILSDDPDTPDNDATVIKAVKYKSQLLKEVYNSNNDSLFTPNEEITYKLTVKNNSDTLTMHNITVKDYFPFEKLDLIDTEGLIINNTTKEIKFTPENFEELTQLPPLTSVELILRAKIKDLTVDGTIIENRAYLSFDESEEIIPSDDPKTEELNDTTKFKLYAKADLTDFTKTVRADNGFFPGNEIRYTLTLKNKGTATAKNITITDKLDDNLEFMEANGSIFENGNVIFSYENTEALKKLPAGKTITFTIKAKIKENTLNSTVIKNQAYISSPSISYTEPSDNPETEEKNDATTFKVINSSLIYASKEVIDENGGNLKQGDIIKYTIKVYNKGNNTSLNNIFYDEIPLHTSYIPSSTEINGNGIEDIDNKPPFLNGIDIGQILPYDNTDNNVVIITFKVKIEDTAPDGAEISNQAKIINNGKETLTDNPETEEKNDPTVIYVNESGNLKYFYKKATLIDKNENNTADIGDEIRYDIEIKAENIYDSFLIQDTIPQNSEYIQGSLKFNGNYQTDEQDSDNAYYSDNNVYFTVNQQGISKISFKVKITGGKKITNQAVIYLNGNQFISDNPDTPEKNDPTIVYIGNYEETKLSITKTVKDLNGSVILAGDLLQYEIKVTNSGNQKAENLEIIDNLPSELEYIYNSEELSDITAHYLYNPSINNGQIKIYDITLNRNDTFTVKFKVKLKDDVLSGKKITNTAVLNKNKQATSTFTVGTISGSANLHGKLFYMNNNKKKPLKNYKIVIKELKKLENTKSYETYTDEQGNFEINNIKPSYYELFYYNTNGTLFGHQKTGYLKSDLDNEFNIKFNPTGYIYNSSDDKKIGQIKIFIYQKHSENDLYETDCSKLDLLDLPFPSQQGQITENNGLYKFDIQTDKEIGICIKAFPDYTYPSAIKNPSFGEIEDEDGYIKNDKYYLEFTPGTDIDNIKNNNIPLDPIANTLKIIQTTDQKISTANSIVTYRIKAVNKSRYEFKSENGIYIYDFLPENFKLVNQSYKIIKTNKEGIKTLVTRYKIGYEDRNILFGPFDFTPEDTIEITYRVTVGSKVKRGKYENTAYILDNKLRKLSNKAKAYIKIQNDFDFDMGAVTGKVYCDDNGNNRQDIGEQGIKGVKIYNDEGFEAITDKYGKYHFTVLPSGLHLIKLDKNSLIPGIIPLEEKRIIRITGGLLEKVNFPLNCREVTKEKIFTVKTETINNGKNLSKELITLRGKANERIFLGNFEITVKDFKINQNKKLVTEDEEITYFVNNLPKDKLINYYIYKFNQNVLTNTTKLDNLYRFIQKRGDLKIKLPAGKYVVFAEISDKNKIYRTSPLISYSQRIPNNRGEGLIEFKRVKFDFKPILFINGKEIKTSKSKTLFHVFHKENLKNASVLYKDSNGATVNLIIKPDLITKIKDNDYLEKFLTAKKNEIKTDYDKFGYKKLLKQLGNYKEKLDRIKNFYGVRITLPKDNSVVYSDKLNLKGYLPPKYKMKINGREVLPQKDGYFDFELNLKPDTDKIKVEVKNDKGKKGEIIRKIKISDIRYFILAFANGTIGYNEPLSNNTYEYLPNSKIYLQGRGVLYFKGEVKGKTLRKYIKNFFKKISATLHIDTAKSKEYQDFYINLINPERFYPVYGDLSKEKQDIKSRGKIYIKIKADDSSLLWGNYNTIIHNSDLVEYDKILYGLIIDFNKKFGNFETQNTLFYSSDKLSSKALYNEFQGTGGSLYYLQSTFIKEGSQRVKIIIRDRESGMEIYKKLLVPNIDYTINYATGTILLKQPLPSHADANFITAGKLNDNTLTGNPVYLAVSYLADTDFNINSDLTAGFSVKETYKNLFFTAHAIKESRIPESKNTDYSLSGMGIGYNFKKNTYIFAEFAHSKNYDNFSFISKDGGITFNPAGEEFANVEGNAFSLKGKISLSDFKNIKNSKLKTLNAVFNYQKQSKYFYKEGNRIGENQGGDKINLITEMTPGKNQKLSLRYLGIITDYNISSDAVNKLEKHQVTLRYDRKLNSKSNFSIEQQSGFISQDRDEDLKLGIVKFKDDFATNLTSFMLTHKYNKDLTLTFGQDIIEQYDKRLKDFTFGDRFTSSLGIQYQITKKISLNATERLKFSGDNSTLLGIRYKTDKNSDLYINQKWLNENTGFSTTLIGAQTNLGKQGKLYGEYQLNSGTENQNDTSRALLGIGKTYKINKNLSLQGGFEQTFYESYNGKQQSRSAISIGADFKYGKNFTSFTKHELRFDNFQESRLHYLTANGMKYKIDTDLTILAKANVYLTQNLDIQATEARMSEISLGFAFRPASYDFLNILGKYSLISQLRPLTLENNAIYEEAGHVLSLAAIYETPFRLQLTEKTTFKYSYISENETDPSLILTMLWINRLAYHLIDKFDIALEYRLRKMFNFDTQSGFLIEGAYKVKKYFYLGIGYNFTSFTDNVFYMNNNNSGGFFVRISGYF